MRAIAGILRFLLGMTLVFSGFVKIIDPVGVGLIMDSYFSFMHLSFLKPLSEISGALLSGAELLTGIALITGFRIKAATIFSFILIGSFTVLTLFLAIYNPITDCGCFGEAIKLTNLETFIKNIVLILMTTGVYLLRKQYIQIAPVKIETIFMVIFAIAVTFLSGYSFSNLPLMDFLQFKAGYDLRESTHSGQGNSSERFLTTLIYSKDGARKEFPVDSIPDSTWTFIDSKTITVKEDEQAGTTFSLSDKSGAEVTDSILSTEHPLLLITLIDLSDVNDKFSERVKNIVENQDYKHFDIYVVTSSFVEDVEKSLSTLKNPPQTLFCDFKTLVSLNRANSGLVLINKGIIVNKWVLRKSGQSDIINMAKEDPELAAAQVVIAQQIKVEMIAVGFIILLLIMRLVCKWIFIRKITEYADRIEQEYQES